jgi:hypothetical protein
MAARGLGAGSGSMAAEMLNRDRFARARQAEDVAFAQGVQGQDLTRQFQNVQSRLAASQSNQDASLRAGMTNQAANMNQLAANRAFMIGARDSVLSAEDARRSQALGASQLDLARRQRRIGLAGAYGDMDPYRQGMNAAFQLGGATLDRSTNMASNAFNNSLATAGSVETFNRNMQASQYNSWMNNNAALQAANMQAGASRQAGTMGMLGSIGGGLLSGAGMAMAFSDKRMKKDIKPLGKAGSVLGLTAYEFSYKGDDKKHKGFMAQDVAKVLPEAVAEVDYKGKKRLAIKPAVIGAALAEELMAAKAA